MSPATIRDGGVDSYMHGNCMSWEGAQKECHLLVGGGGVPIFVVSILLYKQGFKIVVPF